MTLTSRSATLLPVMESLASLHRWKEHNNHSIMSPLAGLTDFECVRPGFFYEEELDGEYSASMSASQCLSRGPLIIETLQELNAPEITDPSLTRNLEAFAWRTYNGVSGAAWKSRPLHMRDLEDISDHNLKTTIGELVPIVPIMFPCCPNGCRAFTRPSSIRPGECPDCSADIYRAGRPVKTFMYFAIGYRLLLDFAKSKTASSIHAYARMPIEPGHTTDFFTSKRFRDFQQAGFFTTEQAGYARNAQDVALSFSTDGVEITRQGTHSVWPGIVTNLNLPPSLRHRSPMVAFLIPGPREPKNFFSFLERLVDELKTLGESGLPAWDSHMQSQFVLKARLCLVTGDMPAISKLMGMKGSNGISPCRFCRIKGQRSNHYYYPIGSRRLVATSAIRTSNPDIQSVEIRKDLRSEITLVDASGDDALASDHGIKLQMRSLLDVPTLVFEHSFALDLMNLVSNVARLFWSA